MTSTISFDWLWRRTKRLANLLYHPRVMDGAQQVTDLLDRYCELNDLDPSQVKIGDAKFIKGLQYVEYPIEVV